MTLFNFDTLGYITYWYSLSINLALSFKIPMNYINNLVYKSIASIKCQTNARYSYSTTDPKYSRELLKS